MLGSPESLSMFEVLQISLSGLVIVFLCLGCLILAIKLLGVIFSFTNKTKPVTLQADAEEVDDEIYAVILSAVSEESGLPLDKFTVESIKELT